MPEAMWERAPQLYDDLAGLDWIAIGDVMMSPWIMHHGSESTGKNSVHHGKKGA
jgi:hypothetical protein